MSCGCSVIFVTLATECVRETWNSMGLRLIRSGSLGRSYTIAMHPKCVLCNFMGTITLEAGHMRLVLLLCVLVPCYKGIVS